MNQLFHVLYVDSDPLMAVEVLKRFNPPQNMSAELIKKLNKKAEEEEQYHFLFSHTSNYKEALRLLLDHNFDPLQKKRGLRPFDTIFFEVKGRTNTEKFGWVDFLANISQLGIHRLGLTNGFLAFGSIGSPANLDILMNYRVCKFIKKPFSLDELNQYFQDYLKILKGSKMLWIEERPETKGEKEVTRRIARFHNPKGKLTSIELASLEKDANDNLLFLRVDAESSSSPQGSLVLGKAMQSPLEGSPKTQES